MSTERTEATDEHEIHNNTLFVLLPDDDDWLPLAGEPQIEPVEPEQPLEEAAVPVEPLEPEVPAESPFPALPRGPSEQELLRRVEADIDRELEDELSFEARERSRRLSSWRLCKALLWLVVLSLPVPLVVGWSYYSQPLEQRPFHAHHDALRPSGSFGLSSGVVGSLLILATLLYVARKQVASRRTGWNLQGWMRFHVASGVLGPAFVLLHSAFLPYSALGVLAFFSMLIVVTSGLMGRYLLRYIPQAVESGELGLATVQRRLRVYERKLERLGMDRELLRPAAPEGKRSRHPWFVTSVIRVVTGDRESRQELRRFRHAVRRRRDLGRDATLVLALVRRLCRERQLFVRYYELRKLVSTWRFLHLWFAVLLLLGAFFHITVAVKHGDLWILGGGR